MNKKSQLHIINAIIWVGTAIAISINPEKWWIPILVGYLASEGALKLLDR